MKGSTAADKDLIQIQLSRKPICLATFLGQLNILASKLRLFAASQVHFRSLAPEDRATLLRSNTPLYLQYITARYLTAKTGLEQLQWILESCDPGSFETLCLTVISLEELTWEQIRFRSSKTFAMYSEYLRLIESFFSFHQSFNCFIANALLFHTDDLTRKELKEPLKVEAFYHKVLSLAEKELAAVVNEKDSFKFSVLAAALSHMKVIFGSMQAANHDSFQTVKLSGLSLPNFFETEEDFLAQKFERIQIQFRSVSPSEAMLRDAINLLINLPTVSPETSDRWKSLMVERVTRVLQDQPEFESLSPDNRKILLRKTVSKTSIMAVMRDCVATKGKDQLRNFIGIINSADRSWESRLKGFFTDLDSLKAAYVQDPKVNSRKVNEPCSRYIGQLLHSVSGLFKNDATFQLLILLTLFDTDGLPPETDFQNIHKMQNVYLRLLNRKCVAADGGCFKSVSEVGVALNQLKILAAVFENYLLGGP